MAKTKKISINAMDKVIASNHTPTVSTEWNGLEIIINHTLSFKHMLEFVDSVTKTCFMPKTETYMPEAKDFAIKSNILEKYSNISLPNNLEHRYEFIYCTDIIDVILKHINTRQFEEIIKAIDTKIENLANANIESINKQMSELYAAFENLQNSMGGIIDGINNGDIMNVVKILTDGSLDESKFVDAYMSPFV